MDFIRDVDLDHLEMSGLPMHIGESLILTFKIRSLADLPKISIITQAEKELYSLYGFEGAKVICQFSKSSDDGALPSDAMIPFFN